MTSRSRLELMLIKMYYRALSLLKMHRLGAVHKSQEELKRLSTTSLTSVCFQGTSLHERKSDLEVSSS